MNTSLARRAGVGAALVGVVAAAMSGLGAGAAAAGPVPGGVINQTLADGTKVRVALFDQSYRIARPITALPLTRQIWASGKVVVDAPGATGGSIDAGYIVGCQVNFGVGAATGNAGISVPLSGGAATPALGVAAPTVSLGPGQATALHLINTTNGDLSPDAGNYLSTSNAFTNGKAGVAYSDEEFHLDGCAGYAQAKAFVTVEVDTASVTGYVTLYSKPFNIG